MITESFFTQLVEAASMAPSSDNMQPWEFEKKGNQIRVYCLKERLLAIDVRNMFTWISIGAAIENLSVFAASQGFESRIEYTFSGDYDLPAAVITLTPNSGAEGNSNGAGQYAPWIGARTTNRGPFIPASLSAQEIQDLKASAGELRINTYSLSEPSRLEELIHIDTEFSAILLQHKPLFDGFFDTLLFTKKEIETIRFGMDIKSLDIPFLFAFIGKRLKGLKVNRMISRLGMGRFVAKILSSRLRKAGAVFLVTASLQNPEGFMEAGRGMERLWLAASAKGFSVHPYGVIPQYLTMAAHKPETFLPHHVPVIQGFYKPFISLFEGLGRSARPTGSSADSDPEHPVVMLRIGRANRQSVRTTVRLRPEQIIR